MTEKADIGLVGLAVMGQNLVLNMEDHGYTVAVHNRTVSKVDDFINGSAKGKNIIGCHSIEELCNNLKTPRKVMLLVKAGAAVDAFIEQVLPYLDKDDIIIDGGNSFFKDTIRRAKSLEEKGYRYIGTGVSGGEEGARRGPSIMPGGSESAWPEVKDIFQAVSAKADNGDPCCEYIGPDGAGHYVKMVHNGIEYGDMQMIAEAYSLMKNVLGMSADEMHEVFKDWNAGDLDSYLIEITTGIMAMKDDDGEPLVEKILDTAGQKGTGKWTSQDALDIGIPAPTIAEAVFARCVSGQKDQRVDASKILTGPEIKYDGDKAELVEAIRKALYASKICSYAQGFALMNGAQEEYGWDLNYSDIALMWRGGCIIRARFLGKIKEAYDNNPKLANLLLDPYFKGIIDECQASWRKVIALAVENGIPTPAFSSALNYYDMYRSERLSANMLQAQRDYFGAHTYERIDKPRGEFFHTNWTGTGGDVSASQYDV